MLSQKKIIATFHDIDYGRIVHTSATNNFSYNYEAAIQSLIASGTCLQTVDQLCQTWVQKLYEIDQQYQSTENSTTYLHACHCLRDKRILSSDIDLRNIR